MNVTTFKTLVQREYWENKSFLWAPTITGAVLLFSVIFALITAQQFIFSDTGITINDGDIDPEHLKQIQAAPGHIGKAAFAMALGPISFVMFFVLYFYVLGSLYDERRDRSILFWKSMPVSDLQTVLSKVCAAFLLIPVISGVIAMITQVALLLLGSIWAAINNIPVWDVVIAPTPLFTNLLNTLFLLIYFSVAMAPLLGWVWFVSATAKRNAFLASILIPGGIILVERLTLRSGEFANMIAGWGVDVGESLKGIVEERAYGDALSQSSFWIGLLVCAVFIAASIYIRRFRDDSY